MKLDWQPIETLPYDRRDVIVWLDNGAILQGWVWAISREHWILENTSDSGKPTHWALVEGP